MVGLREGYCGLGCNCFVLVRFRVGCAVTVGSKMTLHVNRLCEQKTKMLKNALSSHFTQKLFVRLIAEKCQSNEERQGGRGGRKGREGGEGEDEYCCSSSMTYPKPPNHHKHFEPLSPSLSTSVCEW